MPGAWSSHGRSSPERPTSPSAALGAWAATDVGSRALNGEGALAARHQRDRRHGELPRRPSSPSSATANRSAPRRADEVMTWRTSRVLAGPPQSALENATISAAITEGLWRARKRSLATSALRLRAGRVVENGGDSSGHHIRPVDGHEHGSLAIHDLPDRHDVRRDDGGARAAIASSSAPGAPSRRDGRTNTSAAARRSGTSSRCRGA